MSKPKKLKKKAQVSPQEMERRNTFGNFPVGGTALGGTAGAILSAILTARMIDPGRSARSRRERLRKIVGAGIGGGIAGAGLGGIGQIAGKDFMRNMQVSRSENARRQAIKDMIERARYERWLSSSPL